MLLRDRIAVVTGGAAGRGIGQATATRMAEEGAQVAVLDRNGDGATALARDLGDRHLGFACDVTDSTAVEAVIAEVTKRLGQPTVLAAIAGVTQPKQLDDITGPDYELVTDVSMRGSLHCAQALAPRMREAGGGAMVFMSSVAAKRGGGIFGGPHYSAAKGGVSGLTRALARDLAQDTIRVNAVAPGFVDTDITAGQLSETYREAIIASIPLGRAGTAVDVANTILFLASDLAAYVTGEVLDVNGGAHIG